MANEYIYRLSSIDQSLIRSYIRYCLCFSCGPKDFGATTRKLEAAVKRFITQLPILAGQVIAVAAEEPRGQEGGVEVRVTLNDVHSFSATTKHIDFAEFRYTYSYLAQARMPPALSAGQLFTPLPDAPETSTRDAVFAVQASFITGGLLVALYLHHSVADIHGMGQIMRAMSSDLASHDVDDKILAADVAEKSRLRDRLLHARGIRADLEYDTEYDQESAAQLAQDSQLTCGERGACRVLAFNLATIEQTKELINKERFHHIHQERFIHISAFDCLAAPLWKAVSRASWPHGPPEDDTGQLLRLTIPVSIRTRLTNPDQLNLFFGNAVVHVETHLRVLELGKPYDLDAFAHAARQVRTAVARITEPVIRSKIATIQSFKDVSKAAITNRRFDTDLVVTSWADLPRSDVDARLGLGLGAPRWARKIGRSHSAYGCTVLPVNGQEGKWEVQVTLTDEGMKRLLADGGLMKFVKSVA